MLKDKRMRRKYFLCNEMLGIACYQRWVGAQEKKLTSLVIWAVVRAHTYAITRKWGTRPIGNHRFLWTGYKNVSI